MKLERSPAATRETKPGWRLTAATRVTRPEWVAVGMPVARHPPHRSQRAELPHWAPTSGQTHRSPVRPWVADARMGQEAVAEFCHPAPGRLVPLATAPKHLPPSVQYLESEAVQHSVRGGYRKVLVVASENAGQPGPNDPFRPMHTAPKFLLDPQEGASHAFLDRETQDTEGS